MDRNHLGSLLKCRFRLIRSEWGLKVPISTKLPEYASVAGPQIHFNSQGLDYKISVLMYLMELKILAEVPDIFK